MIGIPRITVRKAAMFGALVLVVSCAGIVLANSNVILFTSYFVSRDHARFCCNKYGMSLMKISNQAENDHFESFLRSLPGVTEMWLGLFRGPTSPHPDDFVWSDGDAPTWTNWDNDTLDIIGSNSTANETMCIKAKITEPSGMFWVASPCTDLMEYSCQVGLNASIIPNDLSQAMCPKLVKLDGKDLNRTNSDKNYGYFDIEHSIDSMGNQVGSKLLATPAYSTSECALHCLSNSLCEEAIIISDALCILYSKL